MAISPPTPRCCWPSRPSRNPRAIAQALVDALPANDDIAKVEIAGPGFINFHVDEGRLAARSRRGAGRRATRYGRNDTGARPPRRRRIRLGQPDRPAARRPRPRRGDRRLHRARARRQRLGRGARVLLQRRRRADRQPRASRCRRARRARRPDDAGWPEDGYRGDYINDVADAYLRGDTVEFEGHAVTGAKDPDDLDAIRRFAVAYLRREQNGDLAAFGVRSTCYFLESLAVRRRQGRGNRARAGRARPHLRGRRRAVAAHHRLR